MRSPQTLSIPPIPFAAAVPQPNPSLGVRLDAVLATHLAVLGASPDPVVEALVGPRGDPDMDLVVRRVRLAGDRTVSVAAVPSLAWHDPQARASALATRRAAARLGRRVLLVPEAGLDRQPRLANALLVAGCAHAPVAPRDRLALMAHLVETGGEMPLADAAETMLRSDDPVAAVLALVAHRVLAVADDQPIGPGTGVSIRAAGVRR